MVKKNVTPPPVLAWGWLRRDGTLYPGAVCCEDDAVELIKRDRVTPVVVTLTATVPATPKKRKE